MPKEMRKPLALARVQPLALVGKRLAEVRRPPLRAPAVLEPAELLATIHDEIIPRLMLAHGADPLREQVCPDARLPPTQVEVNEFAVIAVSEDVPAALAFVEKMCSDGLSLESILLDLIAPAARLLGEHWLADLRPFTEVTSGLCTLQQVVHILGPSFAPAREHRGFVVLVAVQPEQHTLGLYLLGEFLRRAGWGVQVAATMPDSELLALVKSQHVEMVGISVSNSSLLTLLSALIASIKKVARNPKMAILLGGPLELGEFAAENGVSACRDPRDAVHWLDKRVTSTDQER